MSGPRDPVNILNHSRKVGILRLRQLQLKTPKRMQRPTCADVVAWAESDLQELSHAFQQSDIGNVALGEDILAALSMVFGRKISRDSIWDLERLTPQSRSLMERVAKIYKRGVEVRGRGDHSIKPHRNEGSNIVQVESLEDVFSSLHSGDLLIVDDNVAKFWWHRLPPGFISLEFSEQKKTVDHVNDIMRILQDRLKVDGRLFVVGGGIAGDVCGFAAGLTDRCFVYVPTTLLSMVDSSIGGKVGVNFGIWGKNQIGLFYPPADVRIWGGWLQTLPSHEIRCGLTEAYKHGLLSGDQRLRAVVKQAATAVDDVLRVTRILTPWLMDMISVKYKIVARDPFEWGERAVLNLGHTVGHALETMAAENGHVVSHGECVAIGLYCALQLSKRYAGFCEQDVLTEMVSLGLIPDGHRLREYWGDDKAFASGRERFLRLLSGDKKNINDQSIRFVLLQAPGMVARDAGGAWTRPLPVEDVWQDLLTIWSEILALPHG